jgi:hypothetical protein
MSRHTFWHTLFGLRSHATFSICSRQKNISTKVLATTISKRSTYKICSYVLLSKNHPTYHERRNTLSAL